MSTPANSPATVIQQSNSHAPILSVGRITIPVIRVFENACHRFFQHKSIEDADRVKAILYNFEASNIQSWVSANRVRLLTLDFPAFLLEFKKKFLPRTWQDSLVSTQIALQGNSSFLTWSESIREANTELSIAGSDYHIPDNKLRQHFTPRLSPNLKAAYDANNTHGDLDKITDLDLWIERVNLLDCELDNKRKEWLKLAMKSNTPASGNKNPVGTTPSVNSHSNSPAASSATLIASAFIPKLTTEERDLLKAHEGCFRCRKFYAGHFSRDCPLGSEGRPSPEDCKNVTLANASLAKKNHASTSTSTTSVAAVFETESDDENIFDDDELDKYVPDTSPLPQHLWWNCHVNDRPIGVASPIRALIDHGCPPVLISSRLANSLSLPRRTLHKAFPVSGAFNNLHSDKMDTPSVLTEYCKIKLLSVDSVWKSRVVKAIICPNLFTDLILGLDFLATNKVVVDAELRTAIAKDSNYDLLNPIIPSPSPQKLSPPIQRKIDNLKFHSGQLEARKIRINIHEELTELFKENPDRFDFVPHTTPLVNLIASIKKRIVELASSELLLALDKKFKDSYHDRFPSDIPHTKDLPSDVYHNIEIKPGLPISVGRSYSCPRKYRDGWKTLLDQHAAAGRIRPSNSPYASPSFIIPKADKSALPRWVNDYRKLNSVTIPDAYPLPRIEDILADCSKGKIWGKIDMTNSFFQTRVNPDHVKYTATLTPFGLWEWLVMPMGLRNAPATHQRRVTMSLSHLIGKICHVYIDDIIIWSTTLSEHKRNLSTVLQALRDAQLFCSKKKSELFALEIDFLGHHISARGIEADKNKVEKVLSWPVPTSSKEVRQFLGLVRYISCFLPALAEHTSVLTPLTKKECNSSFPKWTHEHLAAFSAIKRLVLGRDCLTTIDHQNPGINKIYVTCDASKKRTGAVLSFGPTWETARPVAFDSRQLKGAELHYPVHEQEMLSILRAVTKWRVDLLGAHIHIYTDHKTLQNFDNQKDLSLRQARWMEYLSQYEYTIHYIRGEDNTVADALSRLPDNIPCQGHTDIDAVFTIENDPKLFRDIRKGYKNDHWCTAIIEDLNANKLDDKLGIALKDGLLFAGHRLIIPKYKDLRERLFRLAHDNFGHFGGEKSYALLRDEYYWPNMRRDLLRAYIPACAECQRNKSSTLKPAGPLHPLKVPNDRFESVAIDFIGPLPPDDGKDMLVTMTDCMGADVQIIACKSNTTAQEFARIFFDHWYCENGCPREIISDRDKLFLSKFWKNLMRLTGIKHKLSTSFHPQTDGASER